MGRRGRSLQRANVFMYSKLDTLVVRCWSGIGKTHWADAFAAGLVGRGSSEPQLVAASHHLDALGRGVQEQQHRCHGAGHVESQRVRTPLAQLDEREPPRAAHGG